MSTVSTLQAAFHAYHKNWINKYSSFYMLRVQQHHKKLVPPLNPSSSLRKPPHCNPTPIPMRFPPNCSSASFELIYFCSSVESRFFIIKSAPEQHPQSTCTCTLGKWNSNELPWQRVSYLDADHKNLYGELFFLFRQTCSQIPEKLLTLRRKQKYVEVG